MKSFVFDGIWIDNVDLCFYGCVDVYLVQSRCVDVYLVHYGDEIYFQNVF